MFRISSFFEKITKNKERLIDTSNKDEKPRETKENKLIIIISSLQIAMP